MTEATLSPRRGSLRSTSMFGRVAVILALPVAIVLIWGLVAAVMDSSVIAGPLEALQQIGGSLTSRRYQANLLITLQTVSIAFVLAVIAGGVAGFLLGLAPFWFRAVGPIIQGLYSIPKVTIFPLFLVFLGLGVVSRASFAFLHGFFPMVIIVMAATANLRTTDIYLKLGASLDMSFGQLVRTILLPAVLPSFLTAARLAFGLTFLGAILAEMFSSNGGLGDELVRNMYLVRIDRILAQVVIIGILAVIPNAILRLIEVRISRRMDVGQ